MHSKNFVEKDHTDSIALAIVISEKGGFHGTWNHLWVHY